RDAVDAGAADERAARLASAAEAELQQDRPDRRQQAGPQRDTAAGRAKHRHGTAPQGAKGANHAPWAADRAGRFGGPPSTANIKKSCVLASPDPLWQFPRARPPRSRFLGGFAVLLP